MSKAVQTLTDNNWENIVNSHSGLVIVDVWAPWCGPCRIIGPIIDELSSEYEGKATFGKLNADENNKQNEFRVTGIPTILFLLDGIEVDRVVGAVPKNILVNKIIEHLKSKIAV